jgi:ribosomal protein L40E
MVFALDTGRYIAVALAALLLLILVLAFVTYTRKARTDDGLLLAAKRAGKDTKVCPDCASEAPLEASVCRHCGFEFG